MINVKTYLRTLALALLAITCSSDDNIQPLSDYDLAVISYFKEVALGFEFSNASQITRRWETDMKIYVGGNPTLTHLAELEKIITEINNLSTTGFTIETVTDTLQSNYFIFFGTSANYGKLFPGESNSAASNYGLFYVYWNANEAFNKGHMYVDIIRATSIEQNHLLREELTQSLGLAKDSYLYPESIFQQSYNTKTTEYAAIDKDLIRLLYHPKMKTGLSASQVEEVLKAILISEK